MNKPLQSLLLLLTSIILLKIGAQFFIPIVLGFFFGFFFDVVGNKVVRSLGKRKRRKGVSIVLLLTTTILFFIGLSYIGGYIQDHWGSFTQALAKAYETVESNVKNHPFLGQDAIETVVNAGKESLSFTSLNNVIGSTVGGLFNGILILVYSILTIVYRKKLSLICEIVLPKTKQDTISVIASTVYSYTKGLLILILILFLIYLIGLLMVSTPYALVIALGSALMTLVPTVGTALGGIGAVIATGLLTGSLWKALFVLIRYLSVQQIEEYFILPKVVGKKVELNVLTTITSIIFWGLLRGVAGVFLAIPIMGVIKNLLDEHGNRRGKVMSA